MVGEDRLTVDDVIEARPTTGSRLTLDLTRPNNKSSESWDEHGASRLQVGLRAEPGWTMGFEMNGYVGVTPELMKPLSRGCQIDGEEVTTFESAFAAHRRGTAPDAALPVMERVGGFDLDPDGYEFREEIHYRAAVFALVDEFTGVAMTPTGLDGFDFDVVEVGIPPLCWYPQPFRRRVLLQIVTT